jgi:hypothetical protein
MSAMFREPLERSVWTCAPPGAPQSLSPFESPTTTRVVLWSTLILSTLLLLVWLTFVS